MDPNLIRNPSGKKGIFGNIFGLILIILVQSFVTKLKYIHKATVSL